jgi:hypothetical protein
VIVEDYRLENGAICRDWRCCGHVWQQIVSPNWRGTYGNVTCPDCGEQGITDEEIERRAELHMREEKQFPF